VRNDDLDRRFLNQLRDVAVRVAERGGAVEERAHEAAGGVETGLILDAEETVTRMPRPGSGRAVDVEPAGSSCRYGCGPGRDAVHRDLLPPTDPYGSAQDGRILGFRRHD
jgi:hypothetical protein